MLTSDAEIILVPGLRGSDADHWLNRWAAKLSTARRVEPADWETLEPSARTARLHEEIARATRPVILIAHDLGGHLAPRIAAEQAHKIAGAFIVAPPAPGSDAAEITATPLVFPSLLIASRNDPTTEYATSEALAKAWGAELVDAGLSGHIDIDSGHGPWPEGLMRFAGFLKTL